jgi:hypothetical protein
MMDSAVQRASAISGERLAEYRGKRDQTTERMPPVIGETAELVFCRRFPLLPLIKWLR